MEIKTLAEVFEEEFKMWTARTFRGSEAEIVALRSVAWQWYVNGCQASNQKNVRLLQQLLETAVDEGHARFVETNVRPNPAS